jgi:hypothetical protein
MILLSIVVDAIAVADGKPFERPNRNRRIDRSNWCTFVVKGGKVDRQQVSGQRSDLAAEIRQGVKQRDVVILHPTEQIKIGDRVNPR